MSSIRERFILFFLNIDVYHYSYNTQQPPFYGHHTGQPALAGTSVMNWMILLVQSFTARMHLLTAISAFGLWRRYWSSSENSELRLLEKNPVKDLQSFSGRFINRFFGFK